MNVDAPPVQERYRLLRRIGSGAFGTVYQARDLFLDEDCAVKMPVKRSPVSATGTADAPGAPPSVSDDAGPSRDDLARLFAEPRLLHRVRSPQIVELRDIELIQGVYCLVMEFVPGGSVRDRMGRAGEGRPLPPAFAVRVTREVLSALRAAHSVGVLHRDIKPDNVLLTEEGRVKVSDFGIAKIVDDAREMFGAGPPGSVVGTMLYMSPESLRGECSAQADLWSTAAMLYEMLSGRFPFPGPSTSEMVHQIEEGKLARLDAVLPGVDPDLARIVHKGLARYREERFLDLDAFDRALEALEAGFGCGAGALPGPAAAEVDRRLRSHERHERESDARRAERVDEALARMRSGDAAGAGAELRRMLEQHPGEPSIHRALGDVLRSRGEEAGAFEEYERAFLLDRTDRVAAEGLAELGLRLRRPARTVDALVALVEIEPESPLFHRRLAMAFSEAGERARAIAHMRRSLELDPAQERMKRILARWLKGDLGDQREG